MERTMVGKHITQQLSKQWLFILIKLKAFSQTIYMDIFYSKKCQRKKTANHQTQDVGFHVKILGFIRAILWRTRFQACQVEYTSGWPKSPTSCYKGNSWYRCLPSGEEQWTTWWIDPLSTYPIAWNSTLSLTDVMHLLVESPAPPCLGTGGL